MASARAARKSRTSKLTALQAATRHPLDYVMLLKLIIMLISIHEAAYLHLLVGQAELGHDHLWTHHISPYSNS